MRKFPLGERRLRSNGITDFKYLKGQHTEEELDLFIPEENQGRQTALRERQHGMWEMLIVKKIQF